MARRVSDLVPEADWADRRVGALPPPRSREELAYQRMFVERLDGVPAGLLGRFATV
jgi:asparagine synthase (glutamine-hydrolysing)